MVISHNLQALNTNRIANENIALQGKSVEKVSSGYKMNHVGDDPVGLAMSETMRRQIRGLNQGIENTKAAINFCQVADGALNEVTEMLQRINELSVKAENGTNLNLDRHYLQAEVEQLLAEIDRVSDTTTFNEIYMFKGKVTYTEKVIVTTTMNPISDGKFFQLFGDDVTKTGYMSEELTPDDVTKSSSDMKSKYDANNQPFVSIHMNMGKISDLKDLIGNNFFVMCCSFGGGCPTSIKFTDSVGVNRGNNNIANIRYDYEIGLKKADGSYYDDAAEFCEYIVDSFSSSKNYIQHLEFAYKDSFLYIYDNNNKSYSENDKKKALFFEYEKITTETPIIIPGVDEKLWIQSGSEKGSGLWLEIDAMDTKVLGIDKIDITTIEGAADANTRVKEALHRLAISRSKIGAQQNRLEHTVANEENISEKVSATESRIRDTDLAAEMVRYSNLNVLLQMGVNMIAQADQRIEKILTILQ